MSLLVAVLEWKRGGGPKMHFPQPQKTPPSKSKKRGRRRRRSLRRCCLELCLPTFVFPTPPQPKGKGERDFWGLELRWG